MKSLTTTAATLSIAAAFTLFFAGSLAAAEPTSENNDRLKIAFKKFPEADTDKDGVLTMTEARAWLEKNPATKGKDNHRQNPDIFVPTAGDLEEANVLGRQLAKGKEPLAFEKGNGLRILMTGHSWVAPGRTTLPAIAAAAGYDGHHQRDHISGGGTGAANAIWLKEFGKWQEGLAPKPVLIPALLTGAWDVMTWGSYYEDKPEYYTQWIDLCLEHNPEMVFYIQDGWPRFDPAWKSLGADEIRSAVDASQAELQAGIYEANFKALEKAYPGKVRILPASYAVVDLVHQYLDGDIADLDCVDEKSQGGKKGIYRDGGHLSRSSGIEQLVGYIYYGMLYRRSPATIEGYAPENIPPAFDKKMRAAAWRAIVDSPFAGVDDEDGDGVAD